MRKAILLFDIFLLARILTRLVFIFAIIINTFNTLFRTIGKVKILCQMGDREQMVQPNPDPHTENQLNVLKATC